MLTNQVVEQIENAFGDGVPDELWQLFDELNGIINDASDGEKSLQSTQIISVVIQLYKQGIYRKAAS